MDYKEYLLKQDAINLLYIAGKMWPGNSNAKSYLSTKLNGTDSKRPWTASDNRKAEIAIHELGLQLIKDAPKQPEPIVKQPTPAVKKEDHIKKDTPIKNPVEKEKTMAELLKEAIKDKK